MVRYAILILVILASILYLELDLQYIQPINQQFLPELPLICEPSVHELSGVTCLENGECIWVDDSGLILGCPQAQPPPANDLEGITHWDDWLYVVTEPMCRVDKYPVGDCTAPVGSWEIAELQMCSTNQRCEAITAVGLDHLLIGHQGKNAIYEVWLFSNGNYAFCPPNSTLDHWPVFTDLSGPGSISGLWYDQTTSSVWATMGDGGADGVLVHYLWQGNADFIWQGSWALTGKSGVEGVAQTADSWWFAVDWQNSGERCKNVRDE